MGMSNDLDQEIKPPASFFLAFLMGISLWNASEILLVTSLTYRRLGKLYFGSILASAAGVIICTLSHISNMWVLHRSKYLPAALGASGWIPMVTGQSLVLYSRLHMLYIDARILRIVLGIIIFNAVTLHSIVFVLVMGANSSNPSPYSFAYNVVESSR